MSQINHIKDLSSCGYRISEISKETGADPKTIKKYLEKIGVRYHKDTPCGDADNFPPDTLYQVQKLSASPYESWFIVPGTRSLSVSDS